MPRAMNWTGLRAGANRRASSQRELIMRNRILAIAAIAGAISTPIAAQAQTEITTGVVRGGSVIIDHHGIAVDPRPAFREDLVRAPGPKYTIHGPLIVGGWLAVACDTYNALRQPYSPP